MEMLKQVLLVCAVWCLLDQVYSIPTGTNRGLSSFRSSVVSNPLTSEPSECGKSKRTNEDKLSIFNGEDAKLGDWPWMVAVFLGSPEDRRPEFWCGGSLISNQWVLTAAHCLENQNENTLFVRLGDLNINQKIEDGATPHDVEVDLLVLHQLFRHYVNDIGLIRMKNPVDFTENIHPICLQSGSKYTADEYYDGKQSYIIGWGLTENFNPPDHLQEASVNITSQKKCARQYSYRSQFEIDRRVLCAGGSGIDTCKGDSGGPLMFFNETEKRFYVGGITSGGRGCGNDNFHGVYTRVASFIPWINNVTGGSF